MFNSFDVFLCTFLLLSQPFFSQDGYLAVTDANLFLGRVIPRYFPKIFGPNEDEPLDVLAPKEAFSKMASEIGSGLSAEEVALGFIRVANESMCQPIRNLTTQRGFNLADHAMACFGGAGPQHACAMARALGINRILIYKHAGVLSALGLMAADLVCERQQPVAEILSDAEALPRLINKLNVIQESATNELVMQGCMPELISCDRFFHMRFEGTDTALMISENDATEAGGFLKAFEAKYNREYSFLLRDRSVLVDDVRVRAHGGSSVCVNVVNGRKLSITPPPCPTDWTMCYWEGLQWVKTPIFSMDEQHPAVNETLKPGHHIKGPCIILQGVSTVVVEPNCEAIISEGGNIEIWVDSNSGKSEGPGDQLDPIYLSLFSHRFMGIAEQMGHTLQRTSTSVNIKERLDFSCALFDASGGLVANAPHVPVHLGSMQEAVRFQIAYWSEKNDSGGKEKILEGDVILSNHPQLAGGSHLPDMTIITPVFVGKDIKFFVASRGHHADIGGIAPGSMPPFSKCLAEEGVAIVAFKIVKNGVYQEEEINKIMRCSRKLNDNLSDFKAQIAANTRGVTLIRNLIEEYTMDVVTAYMGHIQDNAEQAVRNLLRKFGLRSGFAADKGVISVEAEEFLDDGSPIHLRVEIDIENGSAVFDFTGTGVEILGNLNAPRSVTASAIIYSLRCMIDDADMPLNQGCLIPVHIKIPPGCLLNPSSEAAVVGGNVLTSQRITDVIFKAFEVCAASQGCTNNLTFGSDCSVDGSGGPSFGYYETIAGGAGAGPGWHGASGVHTHMTNTRITDPEILERRYPVILNKFSFRSNSGGAGQWKGGMGVERVFCFRRHLTVSILSERRALQPYGMSGGGPASRGINLLYMKEIDRTVNLGGKNTVNVYPGDVLYIMTPGGGGYGAAEETVESVHVGGAEVEEGGVLWLKACSSRA